MEKERNRKQEEKDGESVNSHQRKKNSREQKREESEQKAN